MNGVQRSTVSRHGASNRRLAVQLEMKRFASTAYTSPCRPGEVLREGFLKPLGMSQYALAKAIDVPQIRVSAIVNGKRAITPDTELSLARYFGTSPELWMGMQATFDLEMARDQVGAEIEAKIQPRAA